jgi:hypothetical protein
MVYSYFLLSIMLFCLMIAGLVLARWAWQLQGEHYQKLQQLALLDGRRKVLYDTSRALQQMDIDTDVLSLLFSALLDDLRHMIRLDPSRRDLDKQIKDAEAGSKLKGGGSKSGGSAAVATEEELIMTQRHIQRALQVVIDLYRADRISASQFQSARDKLRLLGIRVAVNSCLLMAQNASEREDTMRAMACYRRAESLLNMRGMPPSEKSEKLAYINGERERLFNTGHRGLLLMAGQS